MMYVKYESGLKEGGVSIMPVFVILWRERCIVFGWLFWAWEVDY